MYDFKQNHWDLSLSRLSCDYKKQMQTIIRKTIQLCKGTESKPIRSKYVHKKYKKDSIALPFNAIIVICDSCLMPQQYGDWTKQQKKSLKKRQKINNYFMKTSSIKNINHYLIDKTTINTKSYSVTKNIAFFNETALNDCRKKIESGKSQKTLIF